MMMTMIGRVVRKLNRCHHDDEKDDDDDFDGNDKHSDGEKYDDDDNDDDLHIFLQIPGIRCSHADSTSLLLHARRSLARLYLLLYR